MNHPVTMGPTFNRPVVDASSHQAAQAYVVAGDYKKAAQALRGGAARAGGRGELSASWALEGDGIGLERAPATLDLTLESGGLSTKPWGLNIKL